LGGDFHFFLIFFSRNEKIQHVAATFFAILARVNEYRPELSKKAGNLLIQSLKANMKNIVILRSLLKAICRLSCESTFKELCGMISIDTYLKDGL
jgi:hypothetical protein